MKSYVRSDIAAIRGYASGEQPKAGEQVIKLNTNENPYPPSEAVFEAIRRSADARLSRYPDPFASEFRAAAAALHNVPENTILCGNGSDDLLTILTRTFVASGELLRLPYPSYVLYKTLAELQGAFAEEVRFNDDWSLPSAFSRTPEVGLVDPKTAKRENRLQLTFLPNPNSPSGTVVPKEQITRVVERLPCPIVIDEAYADFAGISCADLVATSPKVIVTRTLSKSYALAGLRFGYCIAHPELISQMNKVKDSYNCDAISIAAATAAILDQEWLTATTQKIVATRERMETSMQQLGFRVVKSFANFTWNTHDSIPVRPIYEHLKSHGILVRYMDYPQWGDGLRISVGTDEQTDRCIELVEQYLTTQKQ
ncbi:MAG: histidinol-phosphate transaminase [Thermoguttaceae bacterium]